MKIISTKLHGLLDYTVAIAIIAIPWIFNFPDGPQTSVLVASGIITIIYSLVTRYELSMAALIPFSFHLFFDTLSGVIIALSPWLFGFYEALYLPHLVIGILEVVVVFLSKNSSRLLNQKHHAKSSLSQ